MRPPRGLPRWPWAPGWCPGVPCPTCGLRPPGALGSLWRLPLPCRQPRWRPGVPCPSCGLCPSCPLPQWPWAPGRRPGVSCPSGGLRPSRGLVPAWRFCSAGGLRLFWWLLPLFAVRPWCGALGWGRSCPSRGTCPPRWPGSPSRCRRSAAERALPSPACRSARDGGGVGWLEGGCRGGPSGVWSCCGVGGCRRLCGGGFRLGCGVGSRRGGGGRGGPAGGCPGGAGSWS